MKSVENFFSRKDGSGMKITNNENKFTPEHQIVDKTEFRLMNPKKRIVKDYENLPEDILNRIKLQYPRGFAQHLITYTNAEGKKVSALPFDTEEVYYLVRMTIQEARQIIAEDDDYDASGNLREDFGDDEDFVAADDNDSFEEPGEEDSHNVDSEEDY